MKRPVENPLIIDLTDIPQSGRQYEYDDASGELTHSLSDVVGSNPFKVNLLIEKIGNAFQASGDIGSLQDLQCSHCGADIKVPVNLKISEILMVQPELPRSGKTARVNHSTELDPMGPDCVLLKRPELNVGDFVREIIVLNEPHQPRCETPCENPYLDNQTTEVIVEKSPFSVLKDFKLNS